MKAINPNIYPKDGYWFMDSDGSKHVGQSWAGLIKIVSAYRSRKGLPTNAVEDEVIAQACSRNTAICTEANPEVKAQTRRVSLKGRVLLWLSRLRDSVKDTPLRFTGDALHAARSDVCIRCSKNTGLPEGCGSCRAALRALMEATVGKRDSDKRLGGCVILGEYLPVSTWIEEQAVDNGELPPECWRKRSL